MNERLRRYQVYLICDAYPSGKYCGYVEAWGLTAQDAVAEKCDGIERRIRGNTFLTLDGDIMYAQAVR